MSSSTIDFTASINRAIGIDGWMEPDELAWLAETASRMNSIVEIGCWQGRSTSVLLAMCPGKVYAVDHWQGGKDEPEHIRESAVGNRERFMANVGTATNLVVMDRSSIEGAAVIESADMIFIDGGHGYEEVRADIRAWLPKAKRLICGHDFFYGEVRQAVLDEFGQSVFQGAGSIWAKVIE